MILDFKKNLHPAEFTFFIIATYLQIRNPNNWWMKSGASKKNNDIDLFNQVTLFEKGSAKEFLLNYHFKKLPGSIKHILLRWLQNEVDLILLNSPVTPLELLEYQCQGKRVITLSLDSVLKGELVDARRDSLEFLLHDLVHADLFFSQHHSQQVRFFNHLYKNLHLFKDLTQDLIFKTDLEAIMSDMNSNHEHLSFCLQSALINHKKRQLQKPSHEPLPLAVENQWMDLMQPFNLLISMKESI